MALDMDLAKRLKTYRTFKNLTQKEVAAHLNVPHSAISDIENGKRDVTVGELKVLSRLYGRSVEEIMSGKKYDYYNIANIARLLSELPDEDLKEVMFIIEYKKKIRRKIVLKGDSVLSPFIIKKTIRYAYGPKKLSEMVRKKPPMI